MISSGASSLVSALPEADGAELVGSGLARRSVPGTSGPVLPQPCHDHAVRSTCTSTSWYRSSARATKHRRRQTCCSHPKSTSNATRAPDRQVSPRSTGIAKAVRRRSIRGSRDVRAAHPYERALPSGSAIHARRCSGGERQEAAVVVRDRLGEVYVGGRRQLVSMRCSWSSGGRPRRSASPTSRAR
jgi:hypothetical protein